MMKDLKLRAFEAYDAGFICFGGLTYTDNINPQIESVKYGN